MQVEFAYNIRRIYILQLYCVIIKDRSFRLAIIFDAGHGVTHQQSNLSKHLKKSNDVVEIFHNTKLKNSNSGVSSMHSKVDRPKYEKKPHLPETADRKIQEASVLSPKNRCQERVNREYHLHDKKNEQDHCPQTLNYQNNSE